MFGSLKFDQLIVNGVMKNYTKKRTVNVVALALYWCGIPLTVLAEPSSEFPPQQIAESSSEAKDDNINFEIINESKWAKVETGKVRSKRDSTLLYLNLDLTRGSRFPFGYHVHVGVYDHEGKLTESIEQKIRHRHHLSRYLGHLHRAIFTPEKIETHPNTIGRIKIVSHEGK